MKKRMVFGMMLACIVLLAACAREPIREESVEPELPGESPQVIVTAIPEEDEEVEERGADPGFTELPEESPEVMITVIPAEGEEAEERSIDPGFTAPAPDGAGDGGMAVPAPDWNPDPDFEVSSDANQGESGTFTIIPEPVE